MKILWTEPAIEDLRNLHGYIAKDSKEFASTFVGKIILSVDKLTDFPRLGRMVPEADQEAIRELLYHNYRIISEADPDKRLFYMLVVDLVREALTKALDLMGIEVPRRM